MAPHANSPTLLGGDGFHSPQSQDGRKREGSLAHETHSHLIHTDSNELHDLICVGFGPASLAIAVALHDALELPQFPQLDLQRGIPPKVAFLERQEHFNWHAGMLLEGARMQITFLKDMATQRNPRSHFTFLNYLYQNDRLIHFTNLNTFLPQRVEFEDYLRWCASHFDDVAEYSQDVLEVRPEKSRKDGNKVDVFSVTSRNMSTGKVTTRRTKHVIIATGGKPCVPKPFPQSHPRVIHSSQYGLLINRVLKNREHPYRIAVVGGGQSSAEIFESLTANFPNAKTSLIIKGTALRPSDDSPFVNEIFNPDRVDGVFSRPASTRAAAIASDRNTNYGVVRIELLERLYETLYMQRLHHESEEDWLYRILPNRTVTRVDDLSSKDNRVRLTIRNNEDSHNPVTEDMDCDLVIVAAGYLRNAHEQLLHGARGLLPGGDAPEKTWSVSRDYRVEFEHGTVSLNAGVWLQGCNEATHGLADSLLSILAVRGGEVVQSIFSGRNMKTSQFSYSNGVNGHDNGAVQDGA
ncbi:hypothetical protein K402DRAFT_354272 [Aulographum hederae CBS 113979]|uniref:L-ornithine N(5)-monooxygenase [NAD(P)H] n=1 Tax=Aulographum hederae CBS 113979 TaxID=1176131 RepID=A0A6G1H2S1_9PEZI|nr:hypothetical protein K402DRAFT_354272 [Aulographum hederae CBS 113979]